MKTTVGIGFDIHPLKRGIPLVLGGVHIPFSKGLAGHSDGDVLTHALIDALLGSIGDRDIGQLFPDTDETYHNVRSLELLDNVKEILRQRGAEIVHLDSIIFAEKPKIAPFASAMKDMICAKLDLKPGQIGIKAKTFEKMGMIGKGKAISVLATAMVSLQG